MSLPVFVRFARQNDSNNFLNWCMPVPGFDPEIAFQPGTVTLAAYNKKHVISYLPVQRPYVLETIGKNPEASDLEAASSVREYIQFLVSQSQTDGASEIMFLSTDEDIANIAENSIFEKLPYSVYRCKIRDLEPKKKV